IQSQNSGPGAKRNEAAFISSDCGTGFDHRHSPSAEPAPDHTFAYLRSRPLGTSSAGIIKDFRAYRSSFDDPDDDDEYGGPDTLGVISHRMRRAAAPTRIQMRRRMRSVAF